MRLVKFTMRCSQMLKRAGGLGEPGVQGLDIARLMSNARAVASRGVSEAARLAEVPSGGESVIHERAPGADRLEADGRK